MARHDDVDFSELPTYATEEWQETDFEDIDWDDVYDEVGDEDEDLYGEDGEES